MRDGRRGPDRSARWIAHAVPGMHPDAPKRNIVVALLYLLGVLFVAVTLSPPLVIGVGVLGVERRAGRLADQPGSNPVVR